VTSDIINVISAKRIKDYVIRIEFDDGTYQEVDFVPFLMHALHPEIRAYLKPELFSTFRIEHGELLWGDYDLCFPITDLYRNQIDKHTHVETAA
jgi:hypothetical protein